MSTGLTWLYVAPFPDATEPQHGASIIQISDYNEAHNYGYWLVSALTNHGNENVRVFIYTTSPNENGFWYYGAEPTWVPID